MMKTTKTEQVMNDSNRFFTELPIEEVRMDEANRELRELAEDAIQEASDLAYSEYIQAMLHSLYEDAFYHTEWDME
jgi:hypothetical protein